MPGFKALPRFICMGLSAAALTACGVAPMVAQQTTAAALAPFTTAAQATNATLQTLGRGMTAMSAQSAQTARQIQIANYNASRYRPQAQPASYQMQRPVTPSRVAKPASNKSGHTNNSAKPSIDVLPKDALDRLTADQAGLQKAAQSEAMTANIGETIFWHVDGREGTAMAESENLMGGFTCRTFVQTIAFEDYFDKASLTACRNGNGAWIQHF